MDTASVLLKSQRFRAERESDWRRLETLLKDLEAGQRKKLSDEDVLALPVLYRATLSSLSVARSFSLDRNLTDYLENLCTRAYFFVYGTRTTLGERISSFFVHDWPHAVRDLWRETLLAAALGILGLATGLTLTLKNSQWFYAFVPHWLDGGRGPSATTVQLAASLTKTEQIHGLSTLASFLFTHNAQIALGAFALGFVFCLPTSVLLFSNGAMLGAFVAVFWSHGLAQAFGGWVLIHGVTELFAITLAGAGGLRIGWAIAFPGQQSRQTAASDAGRRAATVMAGVVVMLAVAGLLEGFARQLIQDTMARYAVALLTALFWSFYFYRRSPHA